MEQFGHISLVNAGYSFWVFVRGAVAGGGGVSVDAVWCIGGRFEGAVAACWCQGRGMCVFGGVKFWSWCVTLDCIGLLCPV